MVREILVDWGGPGSGGKLSVLYFDTAFAIDDQRAAIGAMLGAVDTFLDNAVTWSVRQSGREMATATGALTGEWTDSGTVSGTGASVGQATADSTQALLRWTTGVVVSGRFLKGRTFIPGLESNSFTDGNLNSTVQSGMNSAAIGMVTADVGFSIWHRPVGGSGGVLHPVVSGSVWAEGAVLRRRRG